MFSFTTFFATLFFLIFAVQASPVVALSPRAALDVFVPHITQPDGKTVWTIGQQVTVCWETSDAPQSISNGAYVVLNDYGVIAKDFDLRAGSVNVTVPAVSEGPHYITLFGDSGNYSPVFTISKY